MEKTWMPTIAGILDIVAGIVSFIGIIFVVVGVSMLAYTGGIEPSMGISETLILSIAVIFAIFAVIADILAIIGGTFALRRKNWGLALAGSIAAFFASILLGIAAIVFTVMSKNEFE
ncbi:MAG: hypothetical protein JSV54_04065 [Chloroflexota bacterium]|nr:MAG: hypothetical protein JSV54_04065 [Chloroflexota bacterium]